MSRFDAGSSAPEVIAGESVSAAATPDSFVRKLILFLPLAALIVILDLWSKGWIESRLAHGEFESVFGKTLQFANHRNKGGMWGIGQDWPSWILPTVRLFALGVIFYLLRQTALRDRVGIVALGLVMGGAIGNIHDSLVHGYVRDFLYVDLDIPVFDPFPTFNVADSAICVGVGLLAIQMFRSPAPEQSAR